MRSFFFAIAINAIALCCNGATNEESLPTPPQSNSAETVRSGGRIEHSYEYHLRKVGVPLQPMQSAIERGGIPQANGWYNYGFPMRSYRYGWFGAERQPPRVYTHRGYYGDKMRVEYQNYY